MSSNTTVHYHNRISLVSVIHSVIHQSVLESRNELAKICLNCWSHQIVSIISTNNHGELQGTARQKMIADMIFEEKSRTEREIHCLRLTFYTRLITFCSEKNAVGRQPRRQTTNIADQDRPRPRTWKS